MMAVPTLRRAVWLALVLGASATTGCGQRDSGAVVLPGAAAGTIVQVSGTVTARRGGQTRALAVGDSVSGDDVIATGADGRVAIELLHNRVRWSLGPGREKQVSASAAWTAARGTTEVAVTDERGGTAGRHAERQAADTAATAHAAESSSSGMLRRDPGLLRATAVAELTPEWIDRALQPQLAALRACYVGSDAGSAELTLAVDAEGRVTAIDAPGSESLQECLRAAVAPVRFPAGDGDRRATVPLTLP